MRGRTSSSSCRSGNSSLVYRFEPVDPLRLSAASTSDDGQEQVDGLDDDLTHFRSFIRTAIAISAASRSTARRQARTLPQVELGSDGESDSSLSSLSSSESSDDGQRSESRARSSKHVGRRHAKAATSAIPVQSQKAEHFELGDVVYIASNMARPHLGVLTEIYTVDEGTQDGHDVQRSECELYCKLRYLYWPQEVSQVTSKKLVNLVDQDEIYYTHEAPKVGRRKTKNSLRGGQSTVDDFAHGPSLLYFVVPAQSILAKVNVYPAAAECRAAAASATSSSTASTSVLFNGRRMATHLFLQRAIDPQLELFWNVDWTAVKERGRSLGTWDLIEGDDDVRPHDTHTQSLSVPQTPSRFKPGQTALSPLSTPGKNANEWARMLAKQKGVPLLQPQDRESIRRRREAERIAALLDTPSRRRKQMDSKSRSRRRHRLTLKRARLDLDDDDSELSSTVGEEDQVSLSSDDDDGISTAATSDDEYALDEEEEMSDAESVMGLDRLTEDEDDVSWDARQSTRRSKKRKRAGNRTAPSTPRKRRPVNALFSPVKALVTPRSKARILGTVSHAPTMLPARPRPLDAFSLDELAEMPVRTRAKRLLHVGATPESLPCRREQFDEVLACLEDAVEEGLGGCIYVSGVPGTGKTATVREVIRSLQRRAENNEISPFNFVEVNGMKLQDAHDAYGVLWHALTGMRCSNAVALHHLSHHFGARTHPQRSNLGRAAAAMQEDLGSNAIGPGRATTVVLMDELDQLVTARQDVMYNMFNWPNGLNSRLIVVAVANTMDLPERILHAKVASRLGMTRITFRPYNDRQLVEIVQARLGLSLNDDYDGAAAEVKSTAVAPTQGCETVFATDALVYLAKRVSNVSGDARRMLDICRRAIDAAEEAQGIHVGPQPTPSPITIGDMKRVLDAMVKSGKGAHIARLALQAKVALVAMLLSVRRAGTAEVDLGTITATHMSLCRMHALPLPGSAAVFLSRAENAGHLASMAHLIAHLCAMGLVIAVGSGVASARSGRFGRFVLASNEDEVRLALEQDGDARLRGML